MKRALSIMLALLAGACGKFETESVVLDLRILAIRSNVIDPAGGETNDADEVIDVDMDDLDLGSLSAQLKDVNFYALVADPGERRSLRYTWTMCLANSDGRCDDGEPSKKFGDSELDDPEIGETAQYPHATLPLHVDTATALTALSLIQSDIQKNPVDVLGGVDLDIELRVGGVNDDPADDVYATKKLRIAPRIPEGRLPNQNPSIIHLDGSLMDGGDREVIQGDPNASRCGADPLGSTVVMHPGEVITLFPQEDGTREQYMVPGLDGSSISLTETVSYQWLATRGSWSDETTGGGHDLLGNQSLLGSDWKSPAISGDDLAPVQIWMIQRDERLGTNWIETCIYASPEQ